MPYRTQERPADADRPTATASGERMEEVAVLLVIGAAGAVGVGSAIADPTRTTQGAIGLLMLLLVAASIFRRREGRDGTEKA